jgi:hypothetical protein
MGKVLLLFFWPFLLNPGKAAAQLRLTPPADSGGKAFSFRVLPQNFYNQHLSFFCQKEVQLQKLTTLPLFIRLGAKDYVDFLERKPNAAWLPKQ